MAKHSQYIYKQIKYIFLSLQQEQIYYNDKITTIHIFIIRKLTVCVVCYEYMRVYLLHINTSIFGEKLSRYYSAISPCCVDARF